MAGLYDPYAPPIFPEGGAFGTGSPAETAQQPAGADWLMQGIYNAIGGLAKRAFGASEEMRQGGAYNPAPAVEASMLPMGTGAIAGVPMRAGEAVLGAGPIRAYHGSPHDFDRFDLSRIGSGEGAQAYGHGLYFAEQEAVAKAYRDALAHKNQRPAVIHDSTFGDVPILEQDPTRPGKMYEVNINADPAHFLDWDKPLSQQHPRIQDTVKKMAEAEGANFDETLGLTGRELYHSLNDKINAAKSAAELQSSGIPGIKYLDQGSRPPRALADTESSIAYYKDMLAKEPNNKFAADQLAQYQADLEKYDKGTRNYVVFDDSLVNIMKKYGLLGLPAGGTAAPLFLGQEQKS